MKFARESDFEYLHQRDNGYEKFEITNTHEPDFQ
jgi:hypothetical protein